MDISNISVTWVISLSAVVLILTYFWFFRRDPKHPPSPLRAWPIVGNLLQLDPDPREQFAGFRKQCGDIYSLRLGSTDVVVISGYDVLKEAFVRLADDFSHRAVSFIDIVSCGVNRGVLSANGEVWKEHRTLSMSLLKNFGLGKNELAERIQEEINHFMELLESFNGETKNIEQYSAICISNIMCSILTGQRHEYDDKIFLRNLDIFAECLEKVKATTFLNFFPWLRYVPGDPFGGKSIENTYQQFCEAFVYVHLKKNANVVGEPGNIIAAYLQEIKRKETANEKTTMDIPNLVRLILDLFFGGTVTTSNTLAWFFLYMVKYPEVQEKIFQEIDEVVGLERAPAMKDKVNCVYLTATIMEIQRVCRVISLSVPRIVQEDVNLRGYRISKGTHVIVDYSSILRDSSLWGDDSNNFRPQRFIAKNGSLIIPEAWIPFSIGKRSCLGEGVAKMELFLISANILQRFKIVPADQNKFYSIEGKLGITHAPLPYEIKLVCRRSRV